MCFGHGKGDKRPHEEWIPQDEWRFERILNRSALFHFKFAIVYSDLLLAVGLYTYRMWVDFRRSLSSMKAVAGAPRFLTLSPYCTVCDQIDCCRKS